MASKRTKPAATHVARRAPPSQPARPAAKRAKAAKAPKPAAKAPKPAAKAPKPAAKAAKSTTAARPAKHAVARHAVAKPAARSAKAAKHAVARHAVTKPTAKSAKAARHAVAKHAKPAPTTLEPTPLEPSAAEPAATSRVATVAERARLAGEDGRVVLGAVTAPSGALAIFDVALMGYLPREALEPLIVSVPVPTDRALPVIGTRVGLGRFAERWDHLAIQLGDGAIVRARKLGEAAVDFAQLICMDRAALDHWRHEDSLDQLADFVFRGGDELALARALGAKRLPGGEHGWLDLPLAEAEARADRAAQLKAEHHWRITAELRPHSHHAAALAAARASATGAGALELDGTRVLLVLTGWTEGVFPVLADLDADDRPVRIRIQLARPADGTPARPSASPRA